MVRTTLSKWPKKKQKDKGFFLLEAGGGGGSLDPHPHRLSKKPWPQDYAGTTQTGYILFYSLNDCATKLDTAVTPSASRRTASAHALSA